MKKSLTVCTALLAFGISQPAMSAEGWLATDVNVEAVTNNRQNGKNFQITVSTGDQNQICESTSTTKDIWFPLADSSTSGNDEGGHSRAFTIALTAMVTGKKVSVYSHKSVTQCGRATYIKIADS